MKPEDAASLSRSITSSPNRCSRLSHASKPNKAAHTRQRYLGRNQDGGNKAVWESSLDLTYCPADLWSDQAPRQWRELAPRTEERDDGLHWIVDGQDKGMWNGVGPGFLKYQKGTFHHVDEMKDAGFEWDYRRGAKPRPTTPETRIADLDRTESPPRSSTAVS
jgi:hypothetical protein